MKKTLTCIIVATMPAPLSTVTAASPEGDLAAIVQERDGILSKLVGIAEAGRSRGTTTEEDVRAAKLPLLSFRRDSASTVQDKIKNQELIVDLVEAQREVVEKANRAATATETELLKPFDRVLAEKQLLAELRIRQKKASVLGQSEISPDSDFNIGNRDILNSVHGIAARRLGSGW